MDEKHAFDLERFKVPLPSSEQRDAFQRFSAKEMADAIGTTPFLEEQRRVRERVRENIARKAMKAAAKHGVAAPLLRKLAGAETAPGRSSRPSSRASSASGGRQRSVGGGSLADHNSVAKLREAVEEAKRAQRDQWHSGYTQYTESEVDEDVFAGEVESDEMFRTQVPSSEQGALITTEVQRFAAPEAGRISSRSSGRSDLSVVLGAAVAAPGAEAASPGERSRPSSAVGVRPEASRAALSVLSGAVVAGNANVVEAFKVLEDALGAGGGGIRPSSAASTRSASSSASMVSSRSAASSASAAPDGATRAFRASAASVGRPSFVPSLSTNQHLAAALEEHGVSRSPAASSVPHRSSSASGRRSRSLSTPTVRSAAYHQRGSM